MEGRERFHSRSRSHNLKHDTPQRCRRLRCTGSCHNNLIIFAENMLSFSFMFAPQIPGTEGRAGMAAILDPNGDLDLTELAKGIKEQLPSFARYLPWK